MSIHAMNLVWKNYPKGGSEKLALLALADWCDDEGGNLYPSIGTVAKKICVSPSQARRIIHGFIEDGLLEVVGNSNGGAKSQTRRYQIHLSKLGQTTSVYATPSTDATPCTDARDHWHPCALPLAPMLANTSLTIKEPSGRVQQVEVLDYLNLKANRNYRPVKVNLSLIANRLAEGSSVNECKAVIDAKVAEWSAKPEMQKYLRPATLFNATKFAQYVGAVVTDTTGGQSWE